MLFPIQNSLFSYNVGCYALIDGIQDWALFIYVVLFCYIYHLNKLSVKSVGDAELGLDGGAGHRNQIDIQ